VIVLATIARFVVPQTFSHPPSYTTLYDYSRQTLGAGTVATALVYELGMTALGEELFFRGLIAGWLLGWLGARWGNLAQALVFLVPHVPVILIAPGLWWLVLIAGFGGGLTLGLLRQRTGSILPGLLGHGIGNTVAAAVTMWMAHA
jgi:uncharacterized protein